MEDSPLSIAASITGILTFVAAVLASIYIRYNTLQNGQVELEKVLKSVKISLEETSKVSTQAASSGDPASTQVHQIINDLYELELAIVGHCMSAFGYDKPLQPGFHQVIDSTLTQQHRDLLSLIPDSPTSLLEAIGIILRLGTTRTLMRWYMIREDVLEKMQTRDHLRSRLLMAQISTLSSLVRRHETTMYDNLNILKLEMEVIRSITTDISVSMKRSTDLEEPLEGSPVVD